MIELIVELLYIPSVHSCCVVFLMCVKLISIFVCCFSLLFVVFLFSFLTFRVLKISCKENNFLILRFFREGYQVVSICAKKRCLFNRCLFVLSTCSFCICIPSFFFLSFSQQCSRVQVRLTWTKPQDFDSKFYHQC